jgi:hypothetical protein
MAETRRETTESVTSTDPVTGETVTTDPVSGEVITTDAVPADVVPADVAYVDDAQVYTRDPLAARRAQTYRVQQAIYLVFSIIEGLIAIRFVLEVLAANPAAGFAAFIYGITAPFMAPFVGLFGEPHFGGSVVEWSALVAIIVYGLVSWVLVRLAWLAASRQPVRVTRINR